MKSLFNVALIALALSLAACGTADADKEEESSGFLGLNRDPKVTVPPSGGIVDSHGTVRDSDSHRVAAGSWYRCQ